jgi:poly(hydroxyalkanoate) depolymerase family esterase
MNAIRTLLPVVLVATLACSSGVGSGGEPAPSGATSTPGERASCAAATAAALEEVTAFGENPGKLRMFVHVPAKLAAEPGIVVAMHGCTQDAKAYVGAGWSDFADALGFVVVYPQQESANNANRCFNWFEPAHTKREAGEAKSISEMALHAKKTHGGGRVFATGLSAGAAMTAVMLATYPDVFEAGAILSGLPYGCADSMVNAFGCMSPGKTKSATEWASLVTRAASGPSPRVQIWQGSADYTVRPSNLTALEQQWTGVNDVAAAPTSTEKLGPAEHRVFADAKGEVRVESFLVTGMGHGTALGQSPDGTRCGAKGAFLLDVGVCSTYHAARFFHLDRAGRCE